MSIKLLLSLIIVAAAGAGLAACGGGSDSSSGGGGGVTSSLVVEVSSDNRASALQHDSGRDNGLAAVISDLLIDKALAQTAGVPIFIDGSEAAITDATGSAVVPLAPGTYELCVADLSNCITVVVAYDSVVVVSNITISGDGTVIFGSVSTASAEDNVVEDPQSTNKTLVCHQTGAGQFTISVATPAVFKGHQAHGDTLGPCPEDIQVSNEDGVSDDDDGMGGPAGGVSGPPDRMAGIGGDNGIG